MDDRSLASGGLNPLGERRSIEAEPVRQQDGSNQRPSVNAQAEPAAYDAHPHRGGRATDKDDRRSILGRVGRRSTGTHEAPGNYEVGEIDRIGSEFDVSSAVDNDVEIVTGKRSTNTELTSL